jgi:hypothetical protein
MYLDVLECNWMYSDGLGCTKMCSHVFGFTQINLDALGCTRMHSDVLGCTQKHSDLLGCTRINSGIIGCSISIFQARNNPVWITPRLVSHHIDGVPADKSAWGALVISFPPCPQKRQKKTHTKNKGVGRVLFLTHCLSHLLFLVRLLAVWFA